MANGNQEWECEMINMWPNAPLHISPRSSLIFRNGESEKFKLNDWKFKTSLRQWNLARTARTIMIDSLIAAKITVIEGKIAIVGTLKTNRLLWQILFIDGYSSMTQENDELSQIIRHLSWRVIHTCFNGLFFLLSFTLFFILFFFFFMCFAWPNFRVFYTETSNSCTEPP